MNTNDNSQFQNRFATLSIIEEENNETSMVVSLKENLSHNSNLIRCFQNNQNQEEEKIGCLSNQIQNQDQSNVKSTQSKKRKFDCIEAQEEKSNNKRFKLNNDPADILVQNHLIAQEVKQNAKRNQEEIILLKVKQEVEEFKRQYQNWKRFYERNVKHKKTYIQVITQDKLEYQHRARPRTPTKIKQFQLNVDIRMNVRAASIHRPTNIINSFVVEQNSNPHRRRSNSLKPQSLTLQNEKHNRKRQSRSIGCNFKFYDFQDLNQRLSVQSERKSKDDYKIQFKARKMPDFGFMSDFIPLLNDKPMTIPLDFDSEIEKRMSKRKNQNQLTIIQEQTKQPKNGQNGNKLKPTVPVSPFLLTKKRAQIRQDQNEFSQFE